MLHQCADFLSLRQLEDIVIKLNREDEVSLHSQWELAIIYALSRNADIEVEPDLGKKPDVLWRSKNTGDTFIADVRTVSDEGLEKENPREFYRLELCNQAKKRGFGRGHFSDRPEYEMVGSYGDSKVRLKYPPKNEYKKLFNSDFHKFIDWVKENNPDRAEKRLQGDGFDVTIYYQQNIYGMPQGGGNLAYTCYYSLQNNPILNALKKKADQLKKANFEGVKGIFLADGGCRELTSGISSSTGETYSDEQVIQYFLNNSSSISFVVTLFAKREAMGIFDHLKPLNINGKIFLNPKANFPLQEEGLSALNLIPKIMPEPKLDGSNAANHLRNGWDGPQKVWHTSSTMRSEHFMQTIEFSSKSLLEYLAGKITKEEFVETHNFKMANGDFFESMLKGGYTITQANLQRLNDEDDDKIIFTFEPDVSGRPFESPKDKEK